MATPRFLPSRRHKFIVITTVATSTFTTTTPTQIDPALDLTVEAQAGDVLRAEVSGYWPGPGTGQYITMDVATVVSSALVHFFSNGQATHPRYGIQAWMSGILTSEDTGFGSAVRYAVQAGDIVTGEVTVRPVVYLDSAGSRGLGVNVDQPFMFAVENIGPVQAH